jgi:hypothetical protein
MRTRAPWRAGIAAVAAAVLAGGTAYPAAAAPGAVERAEDSVVTVKRSKLLAVAFAIDSRGNFLTTDQAASRGTDIELIFPGGTRLPARRVDSDAPAGLAVLNVPGAPRLRPLRFSSAGAQIGDLLWTVPPAQRPGGPRIAKVVPVDPDVRTGGEAPKGVLFLRGPRVPGRTGSPVVNSNGRVVAVQRGDRYTFDPSQEAVLISRRPTVLPAYRPPDKNDFPAVPVVIGLGILLLLANLFFVLRRRREVAAVVTTARTPGEAAAPTPAEAAPAAKPEPADDLEIFLKRDGRPSGTKPPAAEPAAANGDPAPASAEPAPEPGAVSGDEDPDDLVVLKPR